MRASELHSSCTHAAERALPLLPCYDPHSPTVQAPDVRSSSGEGAWAAAWPCRPSAPRPETLPALLYRPQMFAPAAGKVPGPLPPPAQRAVLLCWWRRRSCSSCSTKLCCTPQSWCRCERGGRVRLYGNSVQGRSSNAVCWSLAWWLPGRALHCNDVLTAAPDLLTDLRHAAAPGWFGTDYRCH